MDNGIRIDSKDSCNSLLVVACSGTLDGLTWTIIQAENANSIDREDSCNILLVVGC